MLALKLREFILLYIVYFEICWYDLSTGEWIDLPQFSDEKKIYRMPSMKQDKFYKITQINVENDFSHERRNVYKNTTKVEISPINDSIDEADVYKFKVSTEDPTVTSDEYFEENASFSTVTESYKKTTKLPITQEPETTEKYNNESLKANEPEILEHLPVDMLKRVHRVLKSLPVSTEGKIQFLKTFEKTLMSEIESQIIVLIPGGREKRGAREHYDHSYDEHDDHGVGFPSIEGALMAISFLTFAVYLVRLVMLLFRNMNNAVPTTPVPTVFLGKRKRSVDQFNDETANILSSIDGFSSSLK